MIVVLQLAISYQFHHLMESAGALEEHIDDLNIDEVDALRVVAQHHQCDV